MSIATDLLSMLSHYNGCQNKWKNLHLKFISWDCLFTNKIFGIRRQKEVWSSHNFRRELACLLSEILHKREMTGKFIVPRVHGRPTDSMLRHRTRSLHRASTASCSQKGPRWNVGQDSPHLLQRVYLSELWRRTKVNTAKIYSSQIEHQNLALLFVAENKSNTPKMGRSIFSAMRVAGWRVMKSSAANVTRRSASVAQQRTVTSQSPGNRIKNRFNGQNSKSAWSSARADTSFRSSFLQVLFVFKHGKSQGCCSKYMYMSSSFHM